MTYSGCARTQAAESGEGDWTIVGHDLEEFAAVVARHGLWRREVEAFCQAAAPQLALELEAA